MPHSLLFSSFMAKYVRSPLLGSQNDLANLLGQNAKTILEKATHTGWEF